MDFGQDEDTELDPLKAVNPQTVKSEPHSSGGFLTESGNFNFGVTQPTAPPTAIMPTPSNTTSLDHLKSGTAPSTQVSHMAYHHRMSESGCRQQGG